MVLGKAYISEFCGLLLKIIRFHGKQPQNEGGGCLFPIFKGLLSLHLKNPEK